MLRTVCLSGDRLGIKNSFLNQPIEDSPRCHTPCVVRSKRSSSNELLRLSPHWNMLTSEVLCCILHVDDVIPVHMCQVRHCLAYTF